MRSELVHQVARSFGVVLSRRAGVSVGLWGAPGIGKTATAQAILREVPCLNLSLHATTSAADIARALPRPRKLPAWTERQLEHLSNNERLEPQAIAPMIVTTLAGAAPFVLHLEDMHEADPERLEIFKALAHAVTHTHGVGLLITSRGKLPEPIRNHQLEPFTEAETQALLGNDLKAEVPGDALDWLFARTRGNPLFALEFGRYLRRQGFLWSDGERWHWRTPPEDYLPVTVEALISQFLAQPGRSPQARTVLEARAILPSGPVNETAWMALSALDRDAFEQARARLEREGLLIGDQFAHPVFGEVQGRELPAGRRRALADRAVQTFGELDPELAARFVDDSGLAFPEACALFERASLSARTRGDPAQAGRLLARAVERAEGASKGRLALEAAQLIQPVDLPEALRLAEDAVAWLGHDLKAVELLAGLLAIQGRMSEANALIERLPPTDRANSEWLGHLLSWRVSSSDIAGALELLQAHPELLHTTNANTAYLAAFALVVSGQYEPGVTLAADALERLEATPFQQAKLRTIAAFADLYQGRSEQAEARLREVLGVMRQHGDPAALAGTLLNHAITLKNLYRYPEMRDALEEAARLYGELGHTRRLAQTQLQLAALLVRMGQYHDAEDILLEARAQLARLEPSELLVDCDHELSRLYAAWKPLHGLPLALKYAEESLALARRLNNPRLLQQPLFGLAEVELWNRRPERALEISDELLELSGRLNLAFGFCAARTTRGLALEQLGQPEAAMAELRLALEYADLGNGHEINFEIARIANDETAARAELEWFEANGHVLSVQHILERFPALRTQPAQQAAAPAKPRTRLRVLGPMVLEQDGQPIPTRARRRLEVIAYLLEARIAGKVEVSFFDLLDTFYADEPETQGKNTLKQLVFQIRASLGPESILSTSNGYTLGAVSSDAEEFLEHGDSSLWRDAYLDGLGEGWLAGVRDALTLALRAKVEEFIVINPSESVRLGRILCKLEPYDPDVLRLTVRAMRGAGDDRGAVRLFGEHRELLLELGEPVPTTLEAFLT